MRYDVDIVYEKIRMYYVSGLWNETRVRNMVLKEIITKEEFELIVGEKFEK